MDNLKSFIDEYFSEMLLINDTFNINKLFTKYSLVALVMHYSQNVHSDIAVALVISL